MHNESQSVTLVNFHEMARGIELLWNHLLSLSVIILKTLNNVCPLGIYVVGCPLALVHRAEVKGRKCNINKKILHFPSYYLDHIFNQ